MISHNMCYSTLIWAGSVYGNSLLGRGLDVSKAKITLDDVHTSPSGHYFIWKEVKRGVLPEILEDLLNARKVTWAQIAQT